MDKRAEVLGWLKDHLFVALDKLQPYAGPGGWAWDLSHYKIGPLAYEALWLSRDGEAAEKAKVRHG